MCWENVWTSGSRTLSPGLWSHGDLTHQAPLSILTPEENLGLSHAGAQLPAEPGGAEASPRGLASSHRTPVVGTRSKWGHLCFSKPAEARASPQSPSLLRLRRHCSLERNLRAGFPARGQPAGSGVGQNLTRPCAWARTRAAPCWAVLVCRCGSCARRGCVHLCAYTWLSVGVLGLRAQHSFPSLNQALSLPPPPNLLGLPFLSHRLCTRPFRNKNTYFVGGRGGCPASPCLL